MNRFERYKRMEQLALEVDIDYYVEKILPSFTCRTWDRWKLATRQLLIYGDAFIRLVKDDKSITIENKIENLPPKEMFRIETIKCKLLFHVFQNISIIIILILMEFLYCNGKIKKDIYKIIDKQY